HCRRQWADHLPVEPDSPCRGHRVTLRVGWTAPKFHGDRDNFMTASANVSRSSVRYCHLPVAQGAEHVSQQHPRIRLCTVCQSALSSCLGYLLLGNLVQLSLLVRCLVEEGSDTIHDPALFGKHIAALVVQIWFVQGGVGQPQV